MLPLQTGSLVCKALSKQLENNMTEIKVYKYNEEIHVMIFPITLFTIVQGLRIPPGPMGAIGCMPPGPSGPICCMPPGPRGSIIGGLIGCTPPGPSGCMGCMPPGPRGCIGCMPPGPRGSIGCQSGLSTRTKAYKISENLCRRNTSVILLYFLSYRILDYGNTCKPVATVIHLSISIRIPFSTVAVMATYLIKSKFI
jgi:hypothetical protein